MNINRLKQLEIRLSKKLGFTDNGNKVKLRFPLIYSSQEPELYDPTKWQGGKFIEEEYTKEEIKEYINLLWGPEVSAKGEKTLN